MKTGGAAAPLLPVPLHDLHIDTSYLTLLTSGCHLDVEHAESGVRWGRERDVERRSWKMPERARFKEPHHRRL